MDDNQGTIAPLKITINGQEFDETEAQEYIDLGRKTKEYEQKWNTSLDTVWPEYGKSRDQIRQLEGKQAELQQQIEEFNSKKKEGIETTQDVVEAKEAARKLGIVLNDDLEKTGFIKEADLDKYFQKKEQEKQAVNEVLSQAKSLEKDIDGSDGRPKFNQKVILAYASTYGFKSLEEAYEDMHKDTLDAWKAGQLEAKKNKGIRTLTPGGEKSPKQPRIDSNNFKQALGEALGQNNE